MKIQGRVRFAGNGFAMLYGGGSRRSHFGDSMVLAEICTSTSGVDCATYCKTMTNLSAFLGVAYQ